MNPFEYMKLALYKHYFNVILLSDDTLTISERLSYLLKSLITFAPIAFILDQFDLWFIDNQKFFTAVVVFIFINMVFGAVMHFRKNSFKWITFFSKTITMMLVVTLVYLVIEIILGITGDNIVSDGFRTSLQLTTLLYPGSKILKNVFILSNGEHPPKWIMQRIYNFQENGDLSEFLGKKTKEKKFINENIVEEIDEELNP